MGRKEESVIIETVEYIYIGTDEQFKEFMKNIIKDYISENILQPEESFTKKFA